MTDSLDLAMLRRPLQYDICRKAVLGTDLHTVDFLVNGASLFAATRARDRDLWGCFSPDYLVLKNELGRHENSRIARIFSFDAPPTIKPNREALFICPVCGDLGCGAITLELSREGDTVRWSRFGYENHCDDGFTDYESYAAIGPFEFAMDQYLAIIRRAASQHPLLDG